MTLFGMLFATAFQSLWRHRGRSFLTMLSIIIGIASMLATIGIGTGARAKMLASLSDFGTNTLLVYSGNNLETTKVSDNQTPPRPITLKDMTALSALCPAITAATPTLYLHRTTLAYRTQRSSCMGIACFESHNKIYNLPLASGRFLSADDITNSARVIVLGSDVAQTLFGTMSPLGKYVTFGSLPFFVIGVIGKRPNFSEFSKNNTEVFLPYTTCAHLFNPQWLFYPHSVTFQVSDAQETSRTERTIRRTLRILHNLSAGQPDDFTIWNQSALAAAATESGNTFTLFLFIIAFLTLLVGGIGVMNIMLVSVTERTREIGIRRALGATQRMIRLQFLIESSILCVVGGACGILIGCTVPPLIGALVGWNVIIPWSAILIALSITWGLGILFGLYPAHRAAQLPLLQAFTE